MTKKSRILAMLLIALMILSGCQAKKASENEELPKEPIKKEEVLDPEKLEIEAFFDKYIYTKERPIAIMIDNDNEQARPHAGLDEAYLIYEMIIEGGAARFMALYKGDATEKIGPVRSSRHYFLDYVMENDAIYTHYGWSPKAQTDIAAFKINKINGVLGGDGSIFWREKKYKGDWHSAYTSIEKISDMADKKKYKRETAHQNSIGYSDEYLNMETETVANNVNLNYSYKYKTGYIYNPETKLYEKTINGKPHSMQNGNVLKVKNIIIQLIGDTPLGDGTDRRNINTTGSGKGYYITDGYCKSITWSKSSRTANTIYKDESGTPLLINPGKTIINIISPKSKTTIE